MKKFFGFFPVALAMLALSSCSSDEFQDGAIAGDYQLGENEILVTVGGDAEVTRAAFGESINTTDNKLKRSVFWTDGDQLKLYDQKNWMTQTYKFNANATTTYKRFQKGDQVTSVFTLQPKAGQTVDENTYEDGYAVYPNTLSTFEGEDRAVINFNLDHLATITATPMDASKGELNTWNTAQEGRNCGLALWGNLTNKKLQLNYLTAFVRVETQMTVTAVAGQHIYAIINSDKSLTGKFQATNFDYTANASPVLTEVATEGKWKAAVSNSTLTTSGTGGRGNGKLFTSYEKNIAATGTGTDLMNPRGTVVIDLGEYATAGTYSLKFYAPIPAATTQELTVYLTAQVPDVNTSEIACDATTLGSAIYSNAAFTECPKTGNFYKIDVIEKAGINTPHKLQELIKELDAVGRDMTVTLTEALKVKNDGKYDATQTGSHNYIVDLSDYDLKHNITLNFAKGVILDNSSSLSKSALEIKTKAGANALNLNFGPVDGGATAIDTLIVSAESPIAIDKASTGGLPANVVNYSDNKLTIKAPVSGKVIAHGNLTIDQSSIDGLISQLVLCDAVGEVNVKKAHIYEVKLGSDALKNEKALSANVTVKTQSVYIDNILMANMPTVPNSTKATKKDDKFKVYFQSKYAGVKAAGKTTTYKASNGNTLTVLPTAPQLYGWSGNDEVVLLGTFDMSETVTSGITAKNNFTGANYIAVIADTETPSGNAEISNLKGAQGLFASIDNTNAVAIKNLTFSNVAIETAADAQEVGVLAGSIKTGTDDVKISNITLSSGTVNGKGKSASVGGVIGLINTASATGKKVQFSNINSSLTVEGYKGVGGIVGAITTSKAVVEFAGSNGTEAKIDKPKNVSVYNTVANLPTCHVTSVDFSENYLTNGKYIGTIATDAVVTIYVETAPGRTDRTNTIAQWLTGTLSDALKNPIHVYNDLIGFSGIVETSLTDHTPKLMTSWTDVTIKDKKNNDNWYTWTYKPYVGGTAAGAPTDKATGAATTLYLNWLEKM